MSVHSSATPTPSYERSAVGQPAGLDGVASRGQALEREGRPQDARELYESALHGRQAMSSAEAAQLVRWVARTYIQESALDAARDCAIAALAISEASADEAGLGHAENILAIVEWKLSNLDEADRLYRRAHHSAHVAGEVRLAAMTASNIGVIATVRGDDGAARLYFEAALRDARTGGLADQAVAALVNLGLLHMHQRRYDDADRRFAEARELAEMIGESNVLFGSDYPHPEGLADPASYVDELKGVSDEVVRKIMGGNLARLMNTADTVLA